MFLMMPQEVNGAPENGNEIDNVAIEKASAKLRGVAIFVFDCGQNNVIKLHRQFQCSILFQRRCQKKMKTISLKTNDFCTPV